MADGTGPTHLDAAGEAALYEAFRHFWHPVAYADDVGDRPVRVTLLDQQIVVARFSAGVRAFADLCAHRGAAVSLGALEGDRLRCPYHGWTYDSGGACVDIPSNPGRPIPPRARLRPYLAAEACGLVWVCLEDSPHFPLPEFPEYADPAYRAPRVPAYDWRCGAARRVENFVDLTHIPWVHDGVLGSRDHPETPEHSLRRVGHHIAMHGTMREVMNMKTSYVSEGNGGGPITSTHDWRLYMPLSVWWRQVLPDGHRFGLFLAASPIGPKHTRTFSFNFRDFALDEDDEPFVRFQVEQVAEFDRVIVESCRPEELPVDLSAELHVKFADQMSIEYRRWLIELKDELAGEAPQERGAGRRRAVRAGRSER